MGWNAQLYDKAQGFVSEFGKSLISFAEATPGKRIWDLGCGTGTLTAELARTGACVTGTDASPEMIARAQENYPHIPFLLQDATTARFKEPFDIVFSNAAFHWIPQQKSLLQSVRAALKPGGKLVCEMGAKGNIDSIQTAFQAALEKRGHHYKSPFYFPSLNEYGALLNASGYRITYMHEYDRPTPFASGKDGLADWIRQFYHSALSPLSEEKQSSLISELEDKLHPILWKEDRWVADYRRLRFVAS